jgi:AraC-like DNA-binding protein
VTTVPVGLDEKVFPAHKIDILVSSLKAEGIAADRALDLVNLTMSELASPTTRVSLNQTIQCCNNAIRLSTDPYFAYHAGLEFHVSTYGMYGFAMLSSTNFRQTISFVRKYSLLSTPIAEDSFEQKDGSCVWTIVPAPQLRAGAVLYKFIVELYCGILTSVFRDVMGLSFGPRELHVTFALDDRLPPCPEVFGCPVVFRQPENQFLFDATWLEGRPELGNRITYMSVLRLCDRLMEEFELRIGLAGKVREVLLLNLARRRSFDDVARNLQVSTRTLRRKLRTENTTFREILDKLRMQIATKYLSDTYLTIDEIAFALGFSDAASFGHAFRRWTKRAPNELRRVDAA